MQLKSIKIQLKILKISQAGQVLTFKYPSWTDMRKRWWAWKLNTTIQIENVESIPTQSSKVNGAWKLGPQIHTSKKAKANPKKSWSKFLYMRLLMKLIDTRWKLLLGLMLTIAVHSSTTSHMTTNDVSAPNLLQIQVKSCIRLPWRMMH